MIRKRSTNTARCSTLSLGVTMLIALPSFAGTVPSFQSLGDLPGDGFRIFAYDLSADGSVVVGTGNIASDREAFRWTSGGGMVGLGDLAGGSFLSHASGVSADGSVVVGTGNLDINYNDLIGEAFRWTSDGGMVGLGDLAGGSFLSEASGVSADGSVVVGWSISALGWEAIRWTSDGGMVGLGDLAGNIIYSFAKGVSADGSVVVGDGLSTSGLEAFRWTSDGGMVGLGDLAGGFFLSKASGVSGDGSVVVGFGYSSGRGKEAFIWDATNGMQSLHSVLEIQLGLDLTGWLKLREATAITDDGLTICGWGSKHGSGVEIEAWIATLPSAPECAADFIADGFVDVTDLLELLAAWGACP